MWFGKTCGETPLFQDMGEDVDPKLFTEGLRRKGTFLWSLFAHYTNDILWRLNEIYVTDRSREGLKGVLIE